jgi:hypothetical protein
VLDGERRRTTHHLRGPWPARTRPIVSIPTASPTSVRTAIAALALLVVVLFGTVAARDAIERSPYGPVVDDVLARLYATTVACDVTLDPAARCFTITPGTVAAVAEALEHVLLEYGGSIVLSEWRSANGVHHVEVRLSDDLWGSLELWLTEPDGQVVAGRVMHQPKRRNGGP